MTGFAGIVVLRKCLLLDLAGWGFIQNLDDHVVWECCEILQRRSWPWHDSEASALHCSIILRSEAVLPTLSVGYNYLVTLISELMFSWDALLHFKFGVDSLLAVC